MNYERVLLEYPGFDLRRIDLLTGEESWWGQGLGTEVIGLLTNLAFQVEGADYVLAVDVADYNLRSRRAFEKNEYRLVAIMPSRKVAKLTVHTTLSRRIPPWVH